MLSAGKFSFLKVWYLTKGFRHHYRIFPIHLIGRFCFLVPPGYTKGKKEAGSIRSRFPFLLSVPTDGHLSTNRKDVYGRVNHTIG